MKGAVIGCLVAKEQGELAILLGSGQIFGHGEVFIRPGTTGAKRPVHLEALGALAEPVVLGHFLDEHAFSDGGRLVLGFQATEEGIEFILILCGENRKCAGEAVAEIVQAGCGFAGFGDGAGGVLRVGLVGG